MALQTKRSALINEKYLAFIRKLPCAISGRCGRIHAHHVGGKGMGSSKRNDYLAVPLDYEYHVGKGHITTDLLEHRTGATGTQLAFAYLCVYAEYLAGRYDPEMDMELGYHALREMLGGILKCRP